MCVSGLTVLVGVYCFSWHIDVSWPWENGIVQQGKTSFIIARLMELLGALFEKNEKLFEKNISGRFRFFEVCVI